MKIIIILALMITSLHAFAQKAEQKFDFRFGLGTSLLGSGDMITTLFENELNYKINHYFSSSVSVNYGRSNHGVYTSASFIQGNLNLLFSPFRNNRRNDFRIGTGFTAYNISDFIMLSSTSQNIGWYVFENRNSIGVNIIIENTYTISEKFLLGLKLFSQPYENGDINSGVLLKLGIKL